MMTSGRRVRPSSFHHFFCAAIIGLNAKARPVSRLRQRWYISCNSVTPCALLPFVRGAANDGYPPFFHIILVEARIQIGPDKLGGELTFAALLTNGSDAENSPENLCQDGIAKRGKQAHAIDFRK